MDTRLLSLQLNTPDIDLLCRFFSHIGVALEEKKVNKGSSYYCADLGSFQLKVFSIPQRQRSSTPDLSLRVQVTDIHQVMSKLKEMPEVQVVMDVEDLVEGKTALVSDPDGRLVELYGLA